MEQIINFDNLAGKRVLLLGDSRMAFPIAKAMSQNRISVFAGVSIYSNYLEWSRHIQGTFRHPSTDPGTDAALPYILEWLEQNDGIDAIQPVSESASRLITRHRDTFEQHARLIMPTRETIALCSNKGQMFQLCDQLDLPLAPFRLVHSKDTLLEAAREVGFPLIVKPSTVDAELFTRKALIAHSFDDLQEQFPDWPEIHPELILQKYVQGPRHSVIFSADKGKLLKAVEVAALRTHEDDGTGYTTFGVTVAPNPIVKSATERLVKNLNYTSTGCAQFIIDPESQAVTFMELNPRTSLARIAEAAGVPHSLLGLASALDLVPPTNGRAWDTKTGVRYVWTKGDLMRIKRGLQTSDKSFARASSDLLNALGDAFRSRHAIFDLTDPAPAFGTYFNFAIKHLRKPPLPMGQLDQLV
ncbi:MAG: hypothetical protein AAGB16_09980 [Pseudomonadota bacterium]